MSRKKATLEFLCVVAASLFGFGAFTPILICIGIFYILRSLSDFIAGRWLQRLAGIGVTVTVVEAIFVKIGNISAAMVIGIAYPGHPTDYSVILSVLTAVYTTTYVYCALTGIAGYMAIRSAGTYLKNAYSSKTHSNPLLRPVSLGLLAYSMTFTAVSAVQATIVYDLHKASHRIERAGNSRLAIDNTEYGGDSWLDFATALETRSPGNICAGLRKEDGVGILAHDRVLVRPAITLHPDKGLTLIRHPLAQVYVTHCKWAREPGSSS
jgi:hypothetical protein